MIHLYSTSWPRCLSYSIDAILQEDIQAAVCYKRSDKSSQVSCTDGAGWTRCHTGRYGRRRGGGIDMVVQMYCTVISAIAAYRYLQPTSAMLFVMLQPAEPAALPRALQPSAASPSCVGAVTICVFVSKTIVADPHVLCV